MKYKVEKGTELFDQLKQIQRRCQDTQDAAAKIVEELGAQNWTGLGSVLAGGISGIELKERPKGWVKPFAKEYENVYIPSKKAACVADIRERINNLPVVTIKEMADLLQYQSQIYSDHGKKYFSRIPFVYWKKAVVLVEIPESIMYNPLPGMTEITVTEFLKLKEKKTSKTKKKETAL